MNDNFQRGINSFGWNLIAFCFLVYKKDIFYEDYLNKKDNFSCEFSLEERFSQFFEFMKSFDESSYKFSITEGGITNKNVEKYKDSTYFVVQEPFDCFSNVTRHVDEKSWKQMKKFFENSHKMIEKKCFLEEICKL